MTADSALTAHRAVSKPVSKEAPVSYTHLTKFSPGLLDRLAAWQQEFDDNFRWDSGWRSAEIRDRWAREAGELAADVRAELGTRAELVVRLWPLGA